jgi:hypothetical protein
MDSQKKYNKDQIPEFLKDLKRENPFQVPPNYFKHLPDQIMEKIVAEERERKAEHPGWWRYLEGVLAHLWAPKPILALASVLLVLGVWFFWLSSSQPEYFAEFTPDDIQHYVIEHLDEFDENYFHDVAPFTLSNIDNGWNPEEMDDLLDQIIDDLDEETIQNIL